MRARRNRNLLAIGAAVVGATAIVTAPGAHATAASRQISYTISSQRQGGSAPASPGCG